jgi:hypothetical protein
MKRRADTAMGFQWLGVLLVPLLLSVCFAKSSSEGRRNPPNLSRPLV